MLLVALVSLRQSQLARYSLILPSIAHLRGVMSRREPRRHLHSAPFAWAVAFGVESGAASVSRWEAG